MDTSTEPTAADTTRGEIVDLFTALCGDPDNVAVATAADRALHDLDGMLAG
jgi:hypothetical protein